MNHDKQTEYLRYDIRAQIILATKKPTGETSEVFGSLTIAPVYRAPYSYYEHCIRMYITKDHDVLELCSGTGLHTSALVNTGARVIASDISRSSLAVLSQRMGTRVKTQVADMECLPFKNSSFDVVTIAGGLSYGDPYLVDAEIIRVLRPGGTFICVDSLNHNPIYRLNRWLQYKRGNRTKRTLLFMPTMGRIHSIARNFGQIDVRYFGAMSYLVAVFASIIGQNCAAKFSDYIDKLINVHRSAFKFVLIAKGRL